MRKLTASLFTTLDGVVEAPNEWQFAFDDEMGAEVSRTFAQTDAVLLGRNTFVEWAGYWPTSRDEPFASWINNVPKYVASQTLSSVDEWANSVLVTGSVLDFVADLREREGGDISTGGSPTLVRSLFEAGVLDELTLMIHPVVAGGGRKRLFPNDSALSKVELVRSSQTSSGVIIATYRPAA